MVATITVLEPVIREISYAFCALGCKLTSMLDSFIILVEGIASIAMKSKKSSKSLSCFYKYCRSPYILNTGLCML